jgi:hypothetical protein
LDDVGAVLIAEYVDVESGAKNDREALNRAIAHVKKINGTLVIAKLDRIFRRVTYRVSPVFTQNPAAGLVVHARCRREAVWINPGSSMIIGGGGGDVTFSNNGNINFDATGSSGVSIASNNAALNAITPSSSGSSGSGGGSSGTGAVNRNAEKAHFCCPGIATFSPSTDIQIVDQNGVRLWVLDRAASGYGDVNTPAVGGFDLLTDNVTVPALILVSHGENGDGAFLDIGTRMGDTGMSARERENTDGDRIFVEASYSKGQGATRFDDLVLWRTQDQLYTQVSGGSCGIP